MTRTTEPFSPISWFERNGLYFALLVTWVATLGSLYFSEVRLYVPCLFCWYQRILMYPLALILPIGLLRRDRHLPYYVLAFSGLGMATSTYHYLLQKTNLFASSNACTGGVPCSFDYINWLGFITIPFLALVAFILIFFTTFVVLSSGHREQEETGRAPWVPVLATIAFVVLAFTPSFLFEERPEPVATAPGEDLVISSPLVEGRTLYAQSCAACHGAAGEGMPGIGLPLVGTDFLEESSDEAWLEVVREGRPADHPDNQTGIAMPPKGGRPDLTDDDMEAILQYIRLLSP